MAGGDNYYGEEKESLGGESFDWNSMASFQLPGSKPQNAFPERTVQFALMLCAQGTYCHSGLHLTEDIKYL